MPDRTGEPRPGRDTPAPHRAVFESIKAKRERQAAARQALAQAFNDEHQHHARQARAQAVHACNLCDKDGYRGHTVCDHTDHTAAATRGIAAIREILNSRAQPPQPTPKKPPTGHTDPKTTPL